MKWYLFGQVKGHVLSRSVQSIPLQTRVVHVCTPREFLHLHLDFYYNGLVMMCMIGFL